MLERRVDIGGNIYTKHKIITIEHNYGADQSIVGVYSTNDISEITTWHAHELSETLNRQQAYEWLADIPAFAEVVDESATFLESVKELLTDEQAATVPQIYPSWGESKNYLAGARVRYEDDVYRCLQAHTSQTGWEPTNAVSLWVKCRASELPDDPDDPTPPAIEEWVQPDSTNPYMKDDKVLHNGQTWISLVDNNVWEPGAVGTESLWTVFTDE